MGREQKIEAAMAIVKEALENGEIEERRRDVEGEWARAVTVGAWNTYEYRVNPKPREFWLNLYKDFDPDLRLSRDEADKAAMQTRIDCILVREVLK